MISLSENVEADLSVDPAPEVSVIETNATLFHECHVESVDKEKTNFGSDDVVELPTPAHASQDTDKSAESISSGITIEDDDFDNEEVGFEGVLENSNKEMESEIVILEVSDDADGATSQPSRTVPDSNQSSHIDFTSDDLPFTSNSKATPLKDSAVTKRKIVPITGPSPPAAQSGAPNNSSRTITVVNAKKQPIRVAPANQNVPLQSLGQSSSFSNNSSNSKEVDSGKPAPVRNTRTVAAAPFVALSSNRSATTFQHAATIAGFGAPAQPMHLPTTGRLVRAAADPYTSFSQHIPSKRYWLNCFQCFPIN